METASAAAAGTPEQPGSGRPPPPACGPPGPGPARPAAADPPKTPTDPRSPCRRCPSRRSSPRGGVRARRGRRWIAGAHRTADHPGSLGAPASTRGRPPLSHQGRPPPRQHRLRHLRVSEPPPTPPRHGPGSPTPDRPVGEPSRASPPASRPSWDGTCTSWSIPGSDGPSTSARDGMTVASTTSGPPGRPSVGRPGPAGQEVPDVGQDPGDGGGRRSGPGRHPALRAESRGSPAGRGGGPRGSRVLRTPSGRGAAPVDRGDGNPAGQAGQVQACPPGGPAASGGGGDHIVRGGSSRMAGR